jgi:hypothetical protein
VSEFDPLHEFGRLIKQVKHQEYERGWRDAMEAIQRAAITMYRQAGVPFQAVDEGRYIGDSGARSERDKPGDAQEEPAPDEAHDTETEHDGEHGGGDNPRFVTPKWAMLKR